MMRELRAVSRASRSAPRAAVRRFGGQFREALAVARSGRARARPPLAAMPAPALPFWMRDRSGGRGPAPPPDPLAKVAELTRLLCAGSSPALDPELLSALKREVRRSPAAMSRAHDTLMETLADASCAPRLHAVATCDALFQRSESFRAMLVDDIHHFLARAVGVAPNAAAESSAAAASATRRARRGSSAGAGTLPGPAPDADRLSSAAAAALERWTAAHGRRHPRLAIALRVVADALGPDAARPEARRRREERRARRAANARLTARWRKMEAEEIPSLKRDAGVTAAAIEAGLELLLGAAPIERSSEEPRGGDRIARAATPRPRSDHRAGRSDDREREPGGAFGGLRGTSGGRSEVSSDEDAWEDVPEGVPEPAGPGGVGKAPGGDGTLAGASSVDDSVAVAETEDTRDLVAELRGSCTDAERLARELAAALALLASVAVEGGRGGGGGGGGDGDDESDPGDDGPADPLTSEARASAVNALARAKRRLAEATARCRALGVVPDVETPPGKSRRGEGARRGDDPGEGTLSDGSAFPATEGGGVTIAIEGAPRLPEERGDGGGDLGLDRLLEKARRRRERELALEASARRRSGPRPGRGASGGAGGSGGGGGGRGGGTGALSASAAAAAAGTTTTPGEGPSGARVGLTGKRLFRAAASAHNEEVMRALGAAGAARRDETTGFAAVVRGRAEAEAGEAAARGAAAAEAREAKRRRDAPNAKARIENRLKRLGRKR